MDNSNKLFCVIVFSRTKVLQWYWYQWIEIDKVIKALSNKCARHFCTYEHKIIQSFCLCNDIILFLILNFDLFFYIPRHIELTNTVNKLNKITTFNGMIIVETRTSTTGTKGVEITSRGIWMRGKNYFIWTTRSIPRLTGGCFRWRWCCCGRIRWNTGWTGRKMTKHNFTTSHWRCIRKVTRF
jgi:hypothetical protein